MIIDDIKSYIESVYTLYAPMYIDQFIDPESSEAFVLAHDPTSFKEVTYLDKSFSGNFNFSIYAKSTDAQKAAGAITDLLSVLYIKDDLKLSTGLTIRIEPLTSLNLVQMGENNEYIYTASFGLNYYKEG